MNSGQGDTKRQEPVKSPLLVEFIIYLLFALGPLTGNVILVLFGVLSADFSVLPSDLLITIPSFMFPFAFVQLFSGAISDVKGRYTVILLGLSIFGMGMILASLSFSLIIFVLANVLGGIGFGFVNPVLISLITDITPGPKIPKKLGLLGAIANLAVGIGPLLAGQILIVGWRYLYVIFVIITVVGFIIIFSLKRSQPKNTSEMEIREFFSHLGIEIRRPVVLLLILSAFLVSHTSIATIIWTSRSFTHIIPENISGVVLLLYGIMGFVSANIAGLTIKKRGIRLTLSVAMISLIIADFILVLFGNNSFEALALTTIGLLFMGFAGGLLFTSLMYFSQTLSKERRGALAGLTTAGQFIGIAFVTITLEPFFNSGGISLIYIVILAISIVLLVVLILLHKFAKKIK
jgi:DHA1 family bicyclomycin/chloramphenicol resistance-like MFS transporter